MNRKRAAWLLAAAMAVTSIDGTVLMTSGADFTAEGTETIRDFSSDPAVDFETDENLANAQFETDGNFADIQSTVDESSEEIQEFSFGDAATLTEDQETDEISSQDMAGDDKRTAIELELDRQSSITINKTNTKYYFKFTAPEDGLYKFKYHAEKYGEKIDLPSYDLMYIEGASNYCWLDSELKAGESVYVVFTSEDETGYDFCITASSKNYTLEKLEVISEPSDKEYIEMIDTLSSKSIDKENDFVPKTEGLKVQAEYSDGIVEILQANDVSRDGKRLMISFVNDADYDEKTGKYIHSYYLYCNWIEGIEIKIPVKVITLQEYIQTCGDDVKAISLNEEETVKWAGYHGYLYRFDPSESGEYIFNSNGNVGVLDYVLDENGNILKIEGDGQGTALSCTIAYELESGKRYYFLAKSRYGSSGQSVIKLYKNDRVTNVAIEGPKKETFVAGLETISYEGLKVTLDFESGKSVTYTYGDDDFWSLFRIIPDIEYEDGVAVPGGYSLRIQYKDEEIGTVPITVMSLEAYAASGRVQELSEEKTITEVHSDDEVAIYSFTAPKTGKYLFQTDGSSDVEGEFPDIPEVNVYDVSGKSMASGNGTYRHFIRVQLEAGTTYYFAAKFASKLSHPCTYTTSVISCRTVEEICLSDVEKELYIDVDDLSDEAVSSILRNLKITLKFTDGTEEVMNGHATEDHYSVGWSIPEINNGPGEYTSVFSCDDVVEIFTFKVHPFKEYLTDKVKDTLVLDQENYIRIDKTVKSHGFKFTAPEDGFYMIGTRAKRNGEDVPPDCYIECYDSEGNLISPNPELKAGATVYVIMHNYGSDAYDFYVIPCKKPFAPISLEVISPPTEKYYVETLDGRFESNMSPKTDGLKIKVVYSDGQEEVLEAGDRTRADYVFEFTVNIDGEYSASGEYIKKANLNVYLDGASINIPAEYITLPQYISAHKSEIEPFVSGEQKNVEWTGSKGFIYSFIPESEGEYIFASTGVYDTYGYILDEDGNKIDEKDESVDSNFELVNTLEAGKKYYYLACPYDSIDGNGAVKLYKKGDVDPSTRPTETPTPTPTWMPTEPPEPTMPVPSPTPTAAPDPEPTAVPDPGPTAVPDPEPTAMPDPEPTAVPDSKPTVTPSPKPTAAPNPEPTKAPGLTNIPSKIPTPTITLAPQEKLYKITYKLNGGKQNSKNKKTFYKQTVKLYSPTRKGYTFGGWYKDKKFKTKVTSISKNTAKNVTLYAKWIKVTKCKAPANVKLRNSKAKTMTVSYKAVSGAKGYEISYATNSKFKSAKKVRTAAKSKSISKLKKGKTYYVRVRAYKADSTGAKIYGSYSKAAKVKIKK